MSGGEIKARQQASEDLSDIGSLRRNDSFNRYFLRRIRQKAADAERALKYDAMAPDERETTRRLMLAYEDLLKMMAQDEASARKLFPEYVVN